MSRRFLLLTFAIVAMAADADTHPNVASGYDVGKAYAVGGIDNVSLFNGNLNLVLPLGQTYRMDGGLSYGFKLTYGGNPWIAAARSDWVTNPDGSRYWATWWHNVPKVNRTSLATGLYPPHNAGMGWQLSLGYIDKLGLTCSGCWTYYSPDGAEHNLRKKLHVAGNEIENSDIQYSGDGTYLRLKRVVLVESEGEVEYQDLEFPDGTVHRFHASSGVLTEMRDRVGNKVTIAYSPSRDAATLWTITEEPKNGAVTRTHYVRLKTIPFPGALGGSSGGDQPMYMVITQLDLAAFGGARALYDFHYGPAGAADALSLISRRLTDQPDGNFGPTTQAPLLTRVTLPDGSSWSMLKADGTPDYDVGDGVSYSHMTDPGATYSGQLTGLTLPTGGRYAWTYQRWEFPTDSVTGKYGDGAGSFLDRSAGVKDASRLDRNGNLVEHTSYVQKLVHIATLQHPAAPRVSITQVQRRLPESNDQVFSTSVHFFSVATDPSIDEYGMPFTKEAVPDPTFDSTVYTRIDGITNPGQINNSDCAMGCANGKQLYLSSKVHDAAGNLLRYTFLRYEGGPTGNNVADDMNPRVSSERTVYVDDAGSQATIDRGDFDGFGHFRVEQTSGNFGAGDVRTTTTAWNKIDPAVSSTGPSSGTLPGNWTPWPASANWVLNTYTSQAVTEGSQTAKTLACFDPDTGFLQRMRTLEGAAAGGDDLVAINLDTSGAGNVEKQQFFGGDDAGLSTSALCTAPFGTPSYQLQHTYVAGTRATSRYLDNGVAMPFLILDNTIDVSTGLVSAARDTAGFQSTFSYDTSGRLRTFHPPGATFDVTNTFSPSTASAKARVDVSQPSTTSGSLQSKTTFDDFGRVEQEQQLMPNGSWSTRLTKYDGLGNRSKVSELESGTPTHFTMFLNYDLFGRVGAIQTADGRQTTMSYVGVRSTSRTTLVGTAPAQTQEIYDRQGRLQQVIEPNGTATNYTYDVGNRLRTVSMGTQPQRVFDYDLRGLLKSEKHPENGTITYQSYDARGHAHEKAFPSQSHFDLKFTYDAAERVRQIAARDPGAPSAFRPVKTFDFGTSGTEKGKLVTAVRHNYQPFGDVTVADSYTYAGPAGQVSQRVTSIAQGGVPVRTTTETFGYDDLGALTDTAYPTCSGCGGAMWDAVRETNLNGRLTAISAQKNSGGPVIAFASGITYWPNGMMNVLTHGNGVTDTTGADSVNSVPTAMPRPGSITFSGWSACVGVDIQGDSGDQTISSGGTAPLTVFPTGGASAPLFYQWYSGTTELAGATGQTFVAGPLTSTATFTVVVSNACGRKKSRTITVTVCSKPSNVQITPSSMTVNAGQTLTLTASAAGSGITFHWFQGSTEVATGSTYLTPSLFATTTYFVRAVNACGPADSSIVTYTVPLPKPASLVATRSGTSAVVVSWSGSAGAHHYQLERRSGGQPYVVIATVTTSPFVDSLNIASNTTYVYRLRAFDANNGSPSLYSDPDLATTRTFAAIAAGTTIISYTDLNDLLSVLNIVRAANGSSPVGWATVAQGVPAPAVGELIRGAHVAGLRNAMDQALSALGITLAPYTDPSLAGVMVKAVHIEQLQGRTQ